jgi:hypothetical protein
MQVAKWCDSFFRIGLRNGRYNIDEATNLESRLLAEAPVDDILYGLRGLNEMQPCFAVARPSTLLRRSK